MAADAYFARTRKGVVRLSFALAVACCLQSCVGPDFQPPEAPNIASFTPDRIPPVNSAGAKTQRLEISDALPAEWWELFHSRDLNTLIARSLHDNPNVEAAQAAIRVAQANLYAQVGALFPQLDANYNVVGGKVSNEVASPLSNNDPFYTIHTGQLMVTYVPDIWGGTRRQIENLEALKENQRFTNEATFLTLTSSIALGAIQEASLRAQIKATETLIKISKDILGKVRLKKDLGQLSGLEVAAQEALVAQTEAALPPLHKALAQQRDAFIVLSGHLPGEGLPERFDFSSLKLPRNLPLSLPSDLIAQRPDVRATEESMHAACALIGVAIANRLPQFTLTGNIGRAGTQFSDLFSSNPSFLFYTGMFNATQTLFDGFTLQQRQRAAEAGLDQAAAQYRLAVLTAFQNVADTLYAIRHDTILLQKALLSRAAASKTLNLTRLQLEQGQVDFSILLTAQTAYLQAELTVIQADANRFSDTVALFQALGGGWWNRVAPPHVPQPEAWLTSVIHVKPDPTATEYPGATENESGCCSRHPPDGQ